MLTARLTRWSAWAPGLRSEAAWRAWAAAETLALEPFQKDDRPDVSFIPALLRRRCSRLSRIALRCAFDACPEALRSEAGLILANRHGEMTRTYGLLTGLARGERLSPTQFSHSVHNAPAGLYGIATGNHEEASTLAAGAASFVHAWVEAAVALHRQPQRPVLLVTAQEPVPPAFATFACEAPVSLGLALLLETPAFSDRERMARRDQQAPTLHLELDRQPSPPAVGGATPSADGSAPAPHDLRFLRWLLRDGDGTPLRLCDDAGRSWSWTRT